MSLSVKQGASRILSAGYVRVNRDRATAGAESASADGQPRIETREHGGVVQEVVVTCTCGKHIVLECDYGDR
jgi:hypothetical protein